jgi:hypothetical protein
MLAALALSDDSRTTAGILLLTIVAVEFGVRRFKTGFMLTARQRAEAPRAAP